MVQAQGIFTFTFITSGPESQTGANEGKYSSEIMDGVPVYSHDPKYIAALLKDHGFERRKALRVLLTRGPGLGDDVCTVCVAQKLDARR